MAKSFFVKSTSPLYSWKFSLLNLSSINMTNLEPDPVIMYYMTQILWIRRYSIGKPVSLDFKLTAELSKMHAWFSDTSPRIGGLCGAMGFEYCLSWSTLYTTITYNLIIINRFIGKSNSKHRCTISFWPFEEWHLFSFIQGVW